MVSIVWWLKSMINRSVPPACRRAPCGERETFELASSSPVNHFSWAWSIEPLASPLGLNSVGLPLSASSSWVRVKPGGSPSSLRLPTA
jgi:hypothetical protein